MIDIDTIRQLVELMIENDLTEIDLRDGETRVSVKRGHGLNQPATIVTTAPGAGHVAASPVPAARSAGAAPSDEAAAEKAAADEGLIPIKSPMVGTFYAAPDPDSPPYVAVGSDVDPETVVCIVEAMKVFNEIKADMAGTIERILVQNEQPVEFGQPMFLVRPAQ